MDPAIPDIHISDLVISTAGRDHGCLYYCIGREGQYALLANGKNRTVDRPKKKLLRHIQKVLRSDTIVATRLRAGDKVLNSELRKDLAEIAEEMQVKPIGG